MIRKSMLCIILLVSALIVNAQTSMVDAIYLKNGNIYRGTILEQIPSVSVKIETLDKNVITIKMDEIEKIMKEPLVETFSPQKVSAGLKKGYIGMLNLGYGFGVGNSSKGIDFAKLDFINGYQFNPYLSLGFGTGAKLYFTNTENSLVVPAFVDIRAHLLEKTVSPFIAFCLGYTFEITPETRALGLMVNPTLGVTIMIGHRTGVNIGMGYLLQKADGDNVNSLHVDLGLSF